MINDNMENKGKKLTDILKKYDKALIAFSGGCDSSCLLYAAKKSGIDFAAVTFDTSLYPASELENAKNLAASLGVLHEIIKTDQLSIEGLRHNPPDRCYICKREMFSRLIPLKEKFGFEHILDGSNADDLSDYRPGRKAALELGVKSPLEEAGFSKKDVRDFLKNENSPLWEKPSFACYFSRFPFGAAIDSDMIKKVGAGEEALRAMGLESARLRCHGVVARIETNEEDFQQLSSSLRAKAVSALKEKGFVYVCLDLEGYRSGSMNYIPGK